MKSKQAPQRALQKAFYQLRVFSDQVAQLLTSPQEQNYHARGVRACRAEKGREWLCHGGTGLQLLLLRPSPALTDPRDTEHKEYPALPLAMLNKKLLSQSPS